MPVVRQEWDREQIEGMRTLDGFDKFTAGGFDRLQAGPEGEGSKSRSRCLNGS